MNSSSIRSEPTVQAASSCFSGRNHDLLGYAGRLDIIRTALEAFGKGVLATGELVIDAIRNCVAVSRVLLLFVARMVIAEPLEVPPVLVTWLSWIPLITGRVQDGMTMHC